MTGLHLFSLHHYLIAFTRVSPMFVLFRNVSIDITNSNNYFQVLF